MRAAKAGRRNGIRWWTRHAAAVAAGLLAGLVALVAGAAPASAHTRLLSSSPASGSTVAQAPAEIVLTFAQHLLGLGAVAVDGPGGVNVADGAPVLDGAIVTQRLAANRPAGAYHLAYRVVSADGHPVSGEVTFTASGGVGSGSSSRAAAPAAGANSPATGLALPGTETTAAGAGRSSAGAVVGVGVGVGVLVVVSGAAIAIRARRGQRGSTDGA